MWYLTKTAILMLCGLFGYAGCSLLFDALKRKQRADRVLGWLDIDPPPIDAASDPPTRFLLRLGNADEQGELQRRFAEDQEFRLNVGHRRRQLVHSYGLDTLPPEVAESFRETLLKQTGTAQEIEVEQALRAHLDPKHPNLQVELTNKLSRSDRVWRKLTLPSPMLEAEPGGPNLMVSPDFSFGEPVSLLGSVTLVENDCIEINLGIKHGVGPGDVIQIERDGGGWIGTGVIETATELQSRGFFIGDEKASLGDRALIRLDEE